MICLAQLNIAQPTSISSQGLFGSKITSNKMAAKDGQSYVFFGGVDKIAGHLCLKFVLAEQIALLVVDKHTNSNFQTVLLHF